MAYTLKNKGIAAANPNVTANQNYVNALYKEAYNRNATAKELSIYVGKTVKDAANLILGQSRSPFAAAPTPASTAPTIPSIQKPTAAPSSTYTGVGVADTKIIQNVTSDNKIYEVPLNYITPEGWAERTRSSVNPAKIEKGLPEGILPSPRSVSSDPNVTAPSQLTPAGTPLPTLAPPPTKSLFKDSDAYKALSADAKALVDLAFSAFSGTPEQQQIFADALKAAQALADPYSKSQIMLFEAEYKLSIAKTRNDYAAQAEILNRARTDIASELKLNKDFLTLEQQASMAKELTGYNEDLLTIADQAAEKGITFATGARSRALMEERRGSQYQDVIQSSQRQTNFRIKDLELRAARGDIAAQTELAGLPERQGFELQKIGQSAERVLGSTGLGGLGISGFTPQGGALGDVEQERRLAIIKGAQLGLPE